MKNADEKCVREIFDIDTHVSACVWGCLKRGWIFKIFFRVNFHIFNLNLILLIFPQDTYQQIQHLLYRVPLDSLL